MSGRPHEGVPVLGETGDSKLPLHALTYLNMRFALELTATALIAVAIAFVVTDGSRRTVVLLILACLFVISLLTEIPLLNRLRVRYTSYTIGPGYVYITRGAIFRASVMIAAHQILNVETVQGPLLGRFGYAKVRFRCITNSETLGPLDAGAVERVRQAITPLQESVAHAQE